MVWPLITFIDTYFNLYMFRDHRNFLNVNSTAFTKIFKIFTIFDLSRRTNIVM